MQNLLPPSAPVKAPPAIGTITSLSIADIKVADRTRHQHGDIEALAASIAEVGLLHPVVVNSDNVLIAGERRLRAAKQLGWTEIPARVVKGLDDALLALKAERDENTCRLDFAPTEAVKMGEQLEKLEKPEAEKRKAQAKGKPRGTKAVSCGKLPPEKKAKTRDVVGAAVGMSGKKYEAAKKVVAAAKADPALAPVVEEMDRTGNVSKALRETKKPKAVFCVDVQAEVCKETPETQSVSAEQDIDSLQDSQDDESAFWEALRNRLLDPKEECLSDALEELQLLNSYMQDVLKAASQEPYDKSLLPALSKLGAPLSRSWRALIKLKKTMSRRKDMKTAQVTKQPEPEDEPRVQTFDEEVAAKGGAR